MKRLVLIFLGVRLLLLALTVLNGRLPYADGAVWTDVRDDGMRYRFAEDRLLDAHVRWDGKAYLHIASLGYDDARHLRSNTAFFAGFPWMTRTLHVVFFRPLMGEERAARPEVWILAGIILNFACFLGAMVLLHRWVMRRYGDRLRADRACLLLIFAPASFVFHVAHSEAAFLLFALTACLAVEKGRDVGGFLAAAGAAAVRLFGVTLVLPLALLAFERVGGKVSRLGARPLLAVLPPLAVLAVLLRMSEINGHLDAYFHQQRNFFGHASAPDWEGVTYLFSFAESKAAQFVVRDYYQILHALLAFGLMGLGFVQDRRRSGRLAYFALAFMLVVIPLISGTVISMPRYVSVAFPLYAVAAGLLTSSRRTLFVCGAVFALQLLAWVGWMHGWPLVT